MSGQLFIHFLMPAAHWHSGLFQFALLFAVYFCALFLYICCFSAMAESFIIRQFSFWGLSSQKKFRALLNSMKSPKVMFFCSLMLLFLHLSSHLLLITVIGPVYATNTTTCVIFSFFEIQRFFCDLLKYFLRQKILNEIQLEQLSWSSTNSLCYFLVSVLLISF